MPRIDPETGEILEDRPKERTPAEEVEAWHKSIRRTRTSIRRAVMGMGATHMLTLTYRENMLDLKQGWSDLSRFLRAMRDSIGEFHYVVVAERQKRGAWHFHLAVRGRQDLKLIRKHWQHGNPDVKHWKGRLSQMAAYLSKYLIKSFDINNQPDGHRYRRSQGTDPRAVVITVEAECPSDIRHIMKVLFEERSLIGFACTEGGKGTAGHYVWGCTWLDHPLEADP
ncbi:rolling circle replication-associated protein [Erythrobacter sp. HA6-11]